MNATETTATETTASPDLSPVWTWILFLIGWFVGGPIVTWIVGYIFGCILWLINMISLLIRAIRFVEHYGPYLPG